MPLPSGIKTRRFTPSNVLKRSDETTLSVSGVRTGAGLVTSKSSFQVRELDTGVELSFRCGRVVGSADPNAKPRPHELKAPAIALLSAMERPHKIAAQTTVLWPDRTNAGAILVDSTVSVDRDDATCFKLQTGDVEHPIRLCVAESDLVAVKQPTGGLGSIPDMWGKSGLPLTKGQSRNPVVTNVRLKSLKQCEGEDCKDATKKERDLFGRMLRNRMAQYSYCFEAARRKNGSVSRKLDLGFKLDADGVTTNIVGPTDHTLGSCIQRRIRQMQRTVKKGNSFVGEAEFRFPERDR